MTQWVYVCSSSTGEALATTAELREVIGASATSHDDEQQAAVDAASRWVEDVVGYPLTVQVYQELLPAYGMQELILSRIPVINIEAIFDGSDSGTAGEILTSERRLDAQAGIIQRDDAFPWSAPLEWNIASHPVAFQEYREWRVEYAAGYRVDETTSTAAGTTSTQASLPATIKRATLLKAAEFLQPMVGGVVEQSVGDLRIRRHEPRFRDQPRLDVARELLRPFVRIRVL
jgi:hypothetical protein